MSTTHFSGDRREAGPLEWSVCWWTGCAGWWSFA